MGVWVYVSSLLTLLPPLFYPPSGVSFLRTMNIPQLAAHNRTEYVDIAVALCTDPSFYATMVSKITHPLDGVDLIWEDMEVPIKPSSYV
jgi:predicted O-linked N-acetylglucosamine transferase (SPINDLY family)